MLRITTRLSTLTPQPLLSRPSGLGASTELVQAAGRLPRGPTLRSEGNHPTISGDAWHARARSAKGDTRKPRKAARCLPDYTIPP